mgnify:CR=1 FL=1
MTLVTVGENVMVFRNFKGLNTSFTPIEKLITHIRIWEKRKFSSLSHQLKNNPITQKNKGPEYDKYGMFASKWKEKSTPKTKQKIREINVKFGNTTPKK